MTKFFKSDWTYLSDKLTYTIRNLSRLFPPFSTITVWLNVINRVIVEKYDESASWSADLLGLAAGVALLDLWRCNWGEPESVNDQSQLICKTVWSIVLGIRSWGWCKTKTMNNQQWHSVQNSALTPIPAAWLLFFSRWRNATQRNKHSYSWASYRLQATGYCAVLLTVAGFSMQ